MSEQIKPVVIITGAAGGLGSAMCQGMVAAGATVLAVDLPGRFTGTLPSSCQLIEADITTEAGCEQVAIKARQAGSDLVLVNNAGVGMQFINPNFASKPTRFWELTVKQYRDAFDINTHAQFQLARLLAPVMLKRGWGRIINVATSYATMQLPGFVPYGPTKAAVEAATVIWAKDLAGSGVTANVLLPGGAADTRMITDTAFFPDRSKLVPPQAMVGPLRFLSSRAADAINGQRFVAQFWDPTLPEADNLKRSSAQAGWGDQPHAVGG